MINCKQCGTENLDTSKFCLKCGAALDGTATAQPVNADPNQPNPTYYSAQPNPAFAGVQQPEFKMGWFKFIIFFQLFANCLINVLNGFNYVTGNVYGGDAETIYWMFEGLKAVDIVFGIIYFALAAYAIVTRQMLAKYKKNAPLFLYLFNGVNLVITILYIIVVTIMTGVNVMSPSLVGSIAGIIALLVINIIYFQKRQSLFVK